MRLYGKINHEFFTHRRPYKRNHDDDTHNMSTYNVFTQLLLSTRRISIHLIRTSENENFNMFGTLVRLWQVHVLVTKIEIFFFKKKVNSRCEIKKMSWPLISEISVIFCFQSSFTFNNSMEADIRLGCLFMLK